MFWSSNRVRIQKTRCSKERHVNFRTSNVDKKSISRNALDVIESPWCFASSRTFKAFIGLQRKNYQYQNYNTARLHIKTHKLRENSGDITLRREDVCLPYLERAQLCVTYGSSSDTNEVTSSSPHVTSYPRDVTSHTRDVELKPWDVSRRALEQGYHDIIWNVELREATRFMSPQVLNKLWQHQI